MESELKCSNKKHSEINAIKYCPKCNIYLCNKCLNSHLDLLEDHKTFNIDKNIQEIFTRICHEPNHTLLEFYCKTHNKLCCSSCLSKLKGKDNGQHFNCEVCLIEEIKEEKKNKLNENLKYMEELEEKIEELINQLKNIFKTISENKDSLKLKISKIFTNIRNNINEREDELLSEVENIYDKTYFKEDLIRKGEKIPNQIKKFKEKGEIIKKDWDDDRKLYIIINDCINIENNIKIIKEINENIIKSKSAKVKIKFLPEENNQINEFLGKIKNFGEIVNENEEDCFQFKFGEGENYTVSNNGNEAKKIGNKGWNCVIIGDKEIPKNRISEWKIRINSYQKEDNNNDVFIGIGPNTFKGGPQDDCYSIYKKGQKGIGLRMKKNDSLMQNYKDNIKKGDMIKVIIDRKLGNLSFCVNDYNCGIVYSEIPKEESLYPTVVLYEQNLMVELVKS